jgi:putative ABC transport system ATP-binding protein
MFNDLRKVYNLEGREEKVVALKNVSLSPNQELYPIKRGEFVMIRGPSGGGKTTLLNLVGTIDSPSDGELYIMNHRIDGESKDEFLS